MSLESYKSALESNKTEYETKAQMKNRTSFKIGGKADILVCPKNANELCFSLRAAKENGVSAFILGRGTNILVSDGGIEGTVIDMNGISGTEINGEEIVCGAGEKLFSLCVKAKNASLTGLEFAYGIPGSVGGALFMNAGAYGGEIKDTVVSATCIDNDFNIVEIPVSEMKFGYRTSVFRENGFVIVSVKLKLKKGDKSEINEKMEEILKKRAEKQPLEYPSAGSTFKRPMGYYAGALIEQSGLKGRRVGGAEVSQKHAGFIINKDNATANDVLALIDAVRREVKADSGVELEPEVIFIGRR